MSLRPSTFEEALKAHKPLKRSRMANSANTAPPARGEPGTASDADRPNPASRGLRRRTGIGSKAKAGKKRAKKLTDG